MKEGKHTEEPPKDQRSDHERHIDRLLERARSTADRRSQEEQTDIEEDLAAARGQTSPLDAWVDDLLEQARATAHLRTEEEEQQLETRLEEARSRKPQAQRSPEEQAEVERRLDAVGEEHGRREQATEWRTEDNAPEGDPLRLATESHEGPVQDLRMWAMPSDRETWGAMTYLTERHRGDQGICYVRRMSDVDDLVQQLEQANTAESKTLPDIVMLMPRDRDDDSLGFHRRNRHDLLRAITKIRNNPNLLRQPYIIAMGYEYQDPSVREKMLDAGADLFVSEFGYMDVLGQNFRSIPDLLGVVEDMYGEQTFRGKKGFYAEYRHKLQERSRITADTEQELSMLTEILEEHDAERVLDAGCGNGRIALPLAEKGMAVTGIDAATDLVQEAKDHAEADGLKGKANFLAADLRILPMKSGSEDAVMYNWHVFCDLLGNKSKSMVLGEAHRVLRDEGVIILDIPDRKKLSDERDGVYLNDPGGEHIYIGYVPSVEEMTIHLERAGFTNITVRPWQTEQGFPKLTFTAEKPKGESDD